VGGGDWRAGLSALAAGTRRMIQAHPWYATLVHTRPPAGPHSMRHTEFALRLLTGRGATVGAAMTFAALLFRHVIGSTAQESQEARFNARHGLDSPEDFLAAVMSLHDLAAAHGELPLLTSWLAEPSGATPDEQFDLGLTFLLDGIEARLP
jgi:hypothetical protein